MSKTLEEMSREELERELQELRDVKRRSRSLIAHADAQDLIHELEVHQVELEMQNRELREAQELIEESRARYSDLYDFAPVGYMTLDRRGCVLEINITGAALFGVDRAKIAGRPLTAIARMGNTRRFHEHIRAIVQDGGRVATEMTIDRPGRAPIEVQMVSTPSRGRDGKVEAVRTAVVDISIRKELEGRMRYLAEAGEALSSSLDIDTTLATVVRLAVPLLGDLCFVDLVEREGRTRRVHTVFADPAMEAELGAKVAASSSVPGTTTPQQQVIEAGQPVLVEELPARNQDATAPDQGSSQLMRILGGRSMMIVPLSARGRTFGALTLVSAESNRSYTPTDLLLAEEIARRSAMAVDNAQLYDVANRAIRAREDILAMVSHELRNPLSVVVGRAEQILGSQPEPDRRERTRPAMEAILRAADQMNRLVGDLLDAANLEAGHFQIHRSREDIATFLADVVESHAAAAGRRSIRIEAEIPEELPPVLCDRERIVQVLSNLLGNAIKYTPGGGSVRLRAGWRPDRVFFAVDDTGPGIDPANAMRIFNRYWQGANPEQASVGLGLAIARGIVEAHGGDIWVERAPGGGSSFRFTLPLADGALEGSVGKAAPEAG
jgi:PAS domain S-box-containing protein